MTNSQKTKEKVKKRLERVARTNDACCDDTCCDDTCCADVGHSGSFESEVRGGGS